MTILRSYCVVGRMIFRRWQLLLAATILWVVGGCAAAPKAPEPDVPQLPTTAAAGDTTVVAISPPAAPCCKQTLPEFLGITGLFEMACQGIDCLRNRLGMVFPGMEATPPVLAITDPANLDPDQPPAVQSAAAIKAEEDAAPQKIKAIRFLAGIGCGGCYPDVEESLLAALDDCTEEVRYEAVKAIRSTAGNPCQVCRGDSCCSPKVLKKLSAVAYDTTASGCYKEPSARVRRNARLAMNACGGAVSPAIFPPEEGPSDEIDMDGDAPPEGPTPVASADAQPLTFASALALLRTGSTPSAPITDHSLRGAVAARVNGEVIFWDEILARVDLQSAGTLDPAPPESQVQDRVRDELHRAIDNRLLSQEARRRMAPDEVARVVYLAARRDIAGESAGGIAPVAPAAAQDEILADEWVKRCVYVSPEVTRQEMYDYYRANFERYRQPGSVRWEQLSARFDRFASREQADRTLAYVRARILGRNPDWPPGANLQAIETVSREATSLAGLPDGVIGRSLSMMPVGQMSTILQDTDGLHLVRVLERREPRTRPLDEVSDAVRHDMLQQRQSRAVQEHLQQLRRGAEIWVAPSGQVAGAAALSRPSAPTRQIVIPQPPCDCR